MASKIFQSMGPMLAKKAAARRTAGPTGAPADAQTPIPLAGGAPPPGMAQAAPMAQAPGIAIPQRQAGSYLQFSGGVPPPATMSGGWGGGNALANSGTALATNAQANPGFGTGNNFQPQGGWSTQGGPQQGANIYGSTGGSEALHNYGREALIKARLQDSQDLLNALGRNQGNQGLGYQSGAGVMDALGDMGQSGETPGPWGPGWNPDASGGGGSGISDEEQAYIDEYLKSAFDDKAFGSVEEEINAQRDAALRSAYEQAASRGMGDSGAMMGAQGDIYRNFGRDVANAKMEFEQQQISNMRDAASMLFGDKWRALDREQQDKMADIMLDHQIEFQEAMRKMQEGDPGPIESFFNDIMNLFS